MMLTHASELGAQVFQNVEVRSLEFEGERPVRANWQQKAVNGSAANQGKIDFEYLIDASGRNGVMANHYLNNRKYHNVFQNIGFGVIGRILTAWRQGAKVILRLVPFPMDGYGEFRSVMAR